MRQLIELIGQGKVLIDDGMCRVGPGLDASRRDDGRLIHSAGRVIILADAVVQLCRHDHANEALPILSRLGETAAAMRASASGSPEPASKSDAEEASSLAREFAEGGPSTLPWNHVFPENRREGVAPEKVLRLAARFTGHALKALDARWPGNFAGSESMWKA